jgi:hypothetical protein
MSMNDASLWHSHRSHKYLDQPGCFGRCVGVQFVASGGGHQPRRLAHSGPSRPEDRKNLAPLLDEQ